MHAAIQLAPVLAAEKSKTAFYIAGGILVLWALIVSLGIGLRRPDFPTNLMGERTVIAISVVLVLAAVTTAVATSGAPAKGSESTSGEAQTQAAPSVPSTPSGGASPAPATTGGAATTPAPSAGASTKLALAANPSGQLSFNTKTLSARAGQVTIAFTNGSPLEHNVTIAQGSTLLGATPTFLGGSRSLKLTLKAGTYTFYCSVPGHRQAGMEGTLKVS
jgi:plastocyanin